MNSPISAWNAFPYFTGISESQKKIIAFVNALGFGSLKTFDQSLWPKNGVLIGDGTADPELARLFVVLSQADNKFPGAVTLGVREQIGKLSIDLNSSDYRRSIANGTTAFGNRDKLYPAIYNGAMQSYGFSGTGGVDWSKLNENAKTTLEALADSFESLTHWIVVGVVAYAAIEAFKWLRTK